MSELVLTPKPASHYEDLVADGSISLHLTKQEKAVIIKAHDWGVSGLSEKETEKLDHVISWMAGAVRS